MDSANDTVEYGEVRDSKSNVPASWMNGEFVFSKQSEIVSAAQAVPKSRGGNRILLVEWFVFFAHGSMQSGDGLNEVVFQLYIFISIF